MEGQGLRTNVTRSSLKIRTLPQDYHWRPADSFEQKVETRYAVGQIIRSNLLFQAGINSGPGSPVDSGLYRGQRVAQLSLRVRLPRIPPCNKIHTNPWQPHRDETRIELPLSSCTDLPRSHSNASNSCVNKWKPCFSWNVKGLKKKRNAFLVNFNYFNFAPRFYSKIYIYICVSMIWYFGRCVVRRETISILIERTHYVINELSCFQTIPLRGSTLFI